MSKIFKKYGVIALRYLNNKKLLVFCGNSPLYCVDREYTSSQREYHSHKGCDTAEFNLLMNPSCVVHWPPNPKGMEYFNQKTYEKVEGENMSVLEFTSPKSLEQGIKNLSQLLEFQGESNCVRSIVPGEFFSRLDVQYFLWGNDLPLWTRIYRNCFSQNWYLQGLIWFCETYGEDEEFEVIRQIASKHGLSAELTKMGTREGVYCGSVYHKYPRPICDLHLKFTKT